MSVEVLVLPRSFAVLSFNHGTFLSLCQSAVKFGCFLPRNPPPSPPRVSHVRGFLYKVIVRSGASGRGAGIVVLLLAQAGPTSSCGEGSGLGEEGLMGILSGSSGATAGAAFLRQQSHWSGRRSEENDTEVGGQRRSGLRRCAVAAECSCCTAG